MLMDFQEQTVAIKEYVLMGWVGVLIIEEFRQVSILFINHHQAYISCSHYRNS